MSIELRTIDKGYLPIMFIRDNRLNYGSFRNFFELHKYLTGAYSNTQSTYKQKNACAFFCLYDWTREF